MVARGTAALVDFTGQNMSGISPADEALALLQHTPLMDTDLLQMALRAEAHSFLPDAARDAAALLGLAAAN